jgi:apolipoprotein N-acyltransferase
MEDRKLMVKRRLWFIGCGLLLAGSALTQNATVSQLLGLLTCVVLVIAVSKSKTLLSDFYIFGLVFHFLSFYWIPRTIELFGGFPSVISLLLFVLFCVLSSVQFLLVGWLYQFAKKSMLHRVCLSLPLSWLVAEFLVPRLFPWTLVNPQVSWSSFSSLAEYVGVYPLSALLLFWTELGMQIFNQMTNQESSKSGWKSSLAILILCLSPLLLGSIRSSEVERLIEEAPKLKVGVIQGNLAVNEKGDVLQLEANLSKYQQLSDAAVKEGAELLIWPESVVNKWAPEGITTLFGDLVSLHPYPGSPVPIMYGGLSYRSPSNQELQTLFANTRPEERETIVRNATKYFNSALGVDVNGTVRGIYHKKVLMPFGEYVPFADVLPSLKQLSPQTGDFTKGDIDRPIVFPPSGKSKLGTSVAALICYEDLIPSLSREGALHGAQLLVNLTNDAWYGATAAPYQHHLLAAWRAIESRRYLVRATNTGYTAIVNPFGGTEIDLPIFEEGKIVSEVALLDTVTLYAKYGDIVAWILVCIGIVGILSRKLLG